MEKPTSGRPARSRPITLVAAAALVLAVPTTVWASHGFQDVPDSNVFHDDIDWLADTGVTRGCNPPENTEFCPDEPVTRQQMAAFLRRLSEGRIVDAGSVGGLTAEELLDSGIQGPPGPTGPPGPEGPAGTALVAAATTESQALFEVSETASKVQEATIEAPGDGILWVTATMTMSDLDAGTVRIWAQLDDTTCSEDPDSRTNVAFATMSLAGTTPQATSAAASGMVPVTAGEHTIFLCAEASHFGTQPSKGLVPSIEALFVGDGSVSPGISH